jgi:hypothetical protein
MAFADPQSVTVNSVAQSLPRTASEASSSIYTKDDGSYQLSISHENGRRTRRLVKLRSTKFSPDPFLPTQNQKVYLDAHLVVNVPPAGYTIAEQKQVVDALVVWLSSANITKLLGGES